MNNALAIVIGAAIIAAAILFVFRWEYAMGMLLDRWTGTVIQCTAGSGTLPAKANCEPRRSAADRGEYRQAAGAFAQDLMLDCRAVAKWIWCI